MKQQTKNNLLANSNAFLDHDNKIWPKQTELEKIKKHVLVEVN